VGPGDRGGVQQRRSAQDDAIYHLMVAFYEELKEPGVSKAEALRRAQAQLIESRAYAHPYYWSPFLLISNWL
jgi:CHAT domain-containing protein